jgi:hypothetical protein
MAHRISNQSELRQRMPRQRDKAHLAFVALLPCVICWAKPVEVAHVRLADEARGKRETGKSEKPSDCWVVPLCSYCHRTGPHAQHRSNEAEWWSDHRIDVLALCEALYAHSGDYGNCEAIVYAASNQIMERGPHD